MIPTDLKGSWKYRRRTIFSSLGFCAWTIAYVMVWYDGDARLAETIVTFAFGSATTIVMSYVFGATWEDRNIAGKLTDAKVQNIVDRTTLESSPAAKADEEIG